MRKTTFAGLSVLEPGESLSADGYAFTSRDPLVTDHYLRLGALTHRHDGAAALPDPAVALVGSVDASGGALPADTTLILGYTQLDGLSGETALSPVTALTTPPPMEPPANSPFAAVQYTAGSLLTGTYYYALTFTDAGGGETPPGPSIEVSREPGYASGQIALSGLNQGSPWRLYRAKGGQGFDLLTSGTGDTFLDDGLTPLDCGQVPPQENTTNQQSVVNLTLPAVTTDMRVYVSLDGEFTSPALLGAYPAASAGAAVSIALLRADDGAPPEISTAVAGAQKIDPDTELLEWTWKRPVASASVLPGDAGEGDVRLVRAESRLYGFVASAWTPLTAEGGVSVVSASGGASVIDPDAITFVGSGGTSVQVSPNGASAVVTITSSGGVADLNLEDGERITWPSGAVYSDTKYTSLPVLEDTYDVNSMANYGAPPGEINQTARFSISGGTLNVDWGSAAKLRWIPADDRTSDGILRMRFAAGDKNTPLLQIYNAAGTYHLGGFYDGAADFLRIVRNGSVVQSIAVSPDVTVGWLELERKGFDYTTRLFAADPTIAAPVASGVTTVPSMNQAGMAIGSPVDLVLGSEYASPGTLMSFDDLQWIEPSSRKRLVAEQGVISAVLLDSDGGSELRPNVGLVAHPPAITFEGATVAASGASAVVTIAAGGSISQVAASGSGSVASPEAIMFRSGSAGTNILAEQSGASAVVTIAASGIVGPQGDPGPSGSGQIDVSASGGTTVPAATEIIFAASGGLTVGVAPGGSAAVVTIAGGLTRGDVAVTLAGLAASASASVLAPLGNTYKLLALATNRPARVRLYTRQAKLDADQGRAVGIDPTGDHGLVGEVVTTSDELDWDLSPQIDGSILDASTGVPVAITNMDTVTGDVTATFTVITMED